MEFLGKFKEIWLIDFEFYQPEGERPVPVCMVSREYYSGRLIRLWQHELSEPPFSLGPECLFVAFYSSSEWNCHLVLDWRIPTCILDLYAEFRLLTSGMKLPCGYGLLGALTYLGLDALDAADKDSMRQLVMQGGPWSDKEQQNILDYCQSDVDALVKLLNAMSTSIDFPRALLRGRYMAAAARIEFVGVPIDVPTLTKIQKNWVSIQNHLIEQIDNDYKVYDRRSFKIDRWEAWLNQKNIVWPRLPSGALALDDDTFKEMAQIYPAIAPIRELRTALSKLRLNELAVGSDGRNRFLLSAFGSRTGRNQPSTTKFVFGPSVWLRCLIKPSPDRALAYIDYEQQEFGIAGALSGDQAMMEAYSSGDPYLAFAKQAGAVPFDATKHSYSVERDRFKVCALAVQYGMEAEGLAKKLGDSQPRAKELLQLHKSTYPKYWKWSDAIRDFGILHGKLQAVFGWSVHVEENINPRSLRNFPLQANGGEMLRLACCLVTEQGIQVCCPVHDALLIEAPLNEIDDAVKRCQNAMEEASRIVLGGFTIRTEANITRYPDRYIDKRGVQMWKTVSELVGGIDG